jgi:mRNA interferase MazF
MKRGDFVTVALQGDFGKPRPALVVQSDKFNDVHATVTVLPISSELVDAPLFRITLQPDAHNNLQRSSQVLVDKAVTVKRTRLGRPFGTASGEVMLAVNRALAVFLGVA